MWIRCATPRARSTSRTPFAIASQPASGLNTSDGGLEASAAIWALSDDAQRLSLAPPVITNIYFNGANSLADGYIHSADAPQLKLQLLDANAPAAPGAGDTVVDSDAVRKALFEAGDGMRVMHDAAGLRSLVEERLLLELYRQQPDLPAADAQAIIGAVDDAMTAHGPNAVSLAAMSFNQRVLALLDAAQSQLGNGPAFPGLSGARVATLRRRRRRSRTWRCAVAAMHIAGLAQPRRGCRITAIRPSAALWNARTWPPSLPRVSPHR